MPTREPDAFFQQGRVAGLVVEHLVLLDSKQILPGVVCCWFLITCEKGITAASGTAAKWTVDH